MFGSRRIRELEDALGRAEAALENCHRRLAESRENARATKARARTLERELREVLGALEDARARIRKLEAALAEAQPEALLNWVAEALAKRAKPSFAEDEKGPLASFKVGEKLTVLRPENGESNRAFKARVWRSWLKALHQVKSFT